MDVHRAAASGSDLTYDLLPLRVANIPKDDIRSFSS